MSMLMRTGTLVRKSTRKSSVRRTRSAGSATVGSHARSPDLGNHNSSSCSVPASPVAKLHHVYTDQGFTKSAARASLVTSATTIVSYNESRIAYRTSIHRTLSSDTNRQDTTLQIEEATNDAENICDFLCTATQIVCSSRDESCKKKPPGKQDGNCSRQRHFVQLAFITSAVGLSLIVPVIMMVFGVKYLDECPLESRIPIFHMVGGCFGVLKIVVTLYRSLQRRHYGSIDNVFDTVGRQRGIHSRTYRVMDTLLSLFLLVWHILGTVWVLRIWKPPFKPSLHSPDMWCERSLYLFSIAIIVGVDAVMVLVLLGIVCLACVYKTSSAQPGNG